MDKVVSKFKHELQVEIKAQDVVDILGSAEYGCAYWCDAAFPAQDDRKWRTPDYLDEDPGFCTHLLAGGKIKFHDAQDDMWHEMVLDDFITGVKLWLKHGHDGNGALQYDGTLDTCNIDSCDADIIVQYALYGDIVFG